MFFGVNSSNARTSIGALLEVVVEAGLAAQDQGFHHVLFLTNSKNLMHTFKMKTTSDWLDNTRLALWLKLVWQHRTKVFIMFCFSLTA